MFDRFVPRFNGCVSVVKPTDYALLVCLHVCSQVCVKDRNDMETDSDVSLEIPSGTVIAYSILELEIKKNGQYGERIMTES